jgi:Flp pilus assembly protein TadD
MKLATALQLHNYARGLQLNGQQEQAMEIFRLNIKAHPGEWVVHHDAARVAATQGDFATAVAEMKLAIAGAPPESKRAQEALLKRLEAKEDINK